jgi:hypothetical protein
MVAVGLAVPPSIGKADEGKPNGLAVVAVVLVVVLGLVVVDGLVVVLVDGLGLVLVLVEAEDAPPPMRIDQ